MMETDEKKNKKTKEASRHNNMADKHDETDGEGEGEFDDVDELVPLDYLREFEECFRLFDQENTGRMDIKQLGLGCRAMGLRLTETEFKEIMEVADKDNTSYITFETFCVEVYQRLSEIDEHEALKQAFAIFDPENEGFIPADRFKRLMMRLGDPFTEKEAKECIKMGDLQKKKLVQYNDLIPYLLQK